MANRPPIDNYALCASAFVAPGIIALVGLFGTWFQSSEPMPSFLNLLFWQIMLAASYAPMLLVLSLPASWLVARFVFPRQFGVGAIRGTFGLGILAFSLVLQAPNNWRSTAGEVFIVLCGVLLNTLAFVWLSRPPNISFHRTCAKSHSGL